jgi:multisubunit Na+/H+ antiporter MnhG subunit
MSHQCRETLAVIATAAAINGTILCANTCILAFVVYAKQYTNTTPASDYYHPPLTAFGFGAGAACITALIISAKRPYPGGLTADSILLIGPALALLLNALILIVGITGLWRFDDSMLSLSNTTAHGLSAGLGLITCLAGIGYAAAAIAVRERSRRLKRLSDVAQVLLAHTRPGDDHLMPHQPDTLDA